jgi:hypothetical protein
VVWCNVIINEDGEGNFAVKRDNVILTKKMSKVVVLVAVQVSCSCCYCNSSSSSSSSSSSKNRE